MNKKALILGIILGAVAMRIFLVASAPEEHNHDDHSHDSDVHVHADFLMVLDGEKIDLTQDKYQSNLENGVHHDDIHLHDNQGNIIHRHAEGVTFGDFLRSIGFLFTDECITLDTGEEYCADSNHTLSLYVNNEAQTAIDDYIIEDNDRVLMYYGEKDSIEISNLLDSITDEACIYSGTCPERGTPPPEACGLTCEVDASELYPE
jgi:hypothetical protein